METNFWGDWFKHLNHSFSDLKKPTKEVEKKLIDTNKSQFIMENKAKLKLITDAVNSLNIADLTDDKKQVLTYSLSDAVDKIIATKFSEDNQMLQERLKIYYEYQKNYLNIFKEYKEELKFVQSIQEDLRKERSKFFSETLSEVSKSLKDTGVDQPVQNKWIAELVGSYTQSLDLSENLVQETSMKTVDEINNEIKNVVEISQDVDTKDN